MNAPQQVRAALADRGVSFDEEAGPRLRLAHGSAEVVIDFDDLSGGASLVRIAAVVLSGVESGDQDRELLILRAINDRNLRNRFGRFSYDPDAGTIVLSYDLLGEHLQVEEIMHAVTSVAGVADDHDDVLAAEVGGQRAADRTA